MFSKKIRVDVFLCFYFSSVMLSFNRDHVVDEQAASWPFAYGYRETPKKRGKAVWSTQDFRQTLYKIKITMVLWVLIAYTDGSIDDYRGFELYSWYF